MGPPPDASPHPFSEQIRRKGAVGLAAKKLPGGDEMRYVVSMVISIVIWKVVISPAVYEAVKAFETAARVLGG
jgi:hypothetical protein